MFGNHGILGVLFSRMLPVRKPWHFGSTVFQNAPCSQTMAFWEYCFPECSLFVYYKSGGILEKMPPSKKEQNRQNQCIMLRADLSGRPSCSPRTPRTRSGRRRARSNPTWSSTGSRSSRRTRRATRRSGGTERHTGGPVAPDRLAGD